MVLKEDEYHELVDVMMNGCLDIFSLDIFSLDIFLSVLLSFPRSYPSLSYRRWIQFCTFNWLHWLAVFPTVEGGVCFSGNLSPSSKKLSLLPSDCLRRSPEAERGDTCSGFSDLATFFLFYSKFLPGVCSVFSLVIEVSFSSSSSSIRMYEMDSIELFLPCVLLSPFAVLKNVEGSQISGWRMLSIRRLNPNEKSSEDLKICYKFILQIYKLLVCKFFNIQIWIRTDNWLTFSPLLIVKLIARKIEKCKDIT